MLYPNPYPDSDPHEINADPKPWIRASVAESEGLSRIRNVYQVHPQNVRFQNVRFQNVCFQNVRFQNVRFTKRLIYKTSDFKTSGFKKSGFKTSIEIGASKRPVFKSDILIKQKL
jgi:uncharacterized protein YjbI with pentapeptide repeats